MYVGVAVHLVAVLITCLLSNVTAVRRPNIIIVLADDLGWNDVSFHGSNQIQTPNIDALAYNGIILNSHYVPALCTPSRASLMTGKYPTSLGMQHLVILAAEPWGLPLEETLMPQHFKRHGYATHAVGKWHLGYHMKEYTPIYRGFDSHFGYWNGFQDYYDHTMQAESLKGYDMRRGLEVDYSSKGLYSTDAFTNEAVNIIQNHNSTQGPLFLYLSHLAPHAGNPDNPFQAPEDEIRKHEHIDDPERRVYAAMITKLDESLGKVVGALKDSDMLDNSILLFMSDNGAVTFGVHSNRGSNYPLRGLKESPWEGGVRGVAAIWSPLLKESKRVSNQLMHTSDWLPTLFSAAGLDTSELGSIDGVDMWDSLSNNRESPRTEVFNNYDEIEDYSSLRVGSWKIVEGTAQGGEVDAWYGETGRDCTLEYDIHKIFNSAANRALSHYKNDFHVEMNSEKGSTPLDPKFKERVLNLRENSLVTCDYPTLSSFSLISDNHNSTANQMEKFDSEVRQLGDTPNILEAKRTVISELEKIYRKFGFKENSNKFSFSSFERTMIGDLLESGELRNALKCDPLETVCLFNLKSDPCEKVNLARIFPDVVKTLKDRLKELKVTVVRPLNQPDDPFSNPALHNGTWANWCDKKRNKFSQMLMKYLERISSAFYYDNLPIVFFENLFHKNLIYQTLLTIHESSVYSLQLAKWLCLILCTGGIFYVICSIMTTIKLPKHPNRKTSWTTWEGFSMRFNTNLIRNSEGRKAAFG